MINSFTCYLPLLNFRIAMHQPMDNKKETGSPGRERIDINEKDEVDYWTEKFGITKVKLKAAVNAVGDTSRAVEAYLKKK